MDRPCIEPRAPAAHRDEQFALERIEHHAKLQPPAALVGDRHAELRKAMREVGGTVERIDNPSMLARACVRAALFGQDRVAGKGAAEGADDDALRLVVGLGHQIDRVGLAGDPDAA